MILHVRKNVALPRVCLEELEKKQANFFSAIFLPQMSDAKVKVGHQKVFSISTTNDSSIHSVCSKKCCLAVSALKSLKKSV